MSVGHKYLSLGRPEGKPISFYLNKKAVYTFLHLVGRINLGAFYSKSSKTFGENIFKNMNMRKGQFQEISERWCLINSIKGCLPAIN